MLGNGGQKMNSQPVRRWIVYSDKVGTRLHQVRHEGKISSQPIQLGDAQGGPMQSTRRQRRRKLRPVRPLARLYLHKLRNDAMPAAGGMLLDRALLRGKA
ncbi:hypothetical protein IH86_21545 [Sphingobium yanoikuyae]|nr:hypothetical protein IH86_21545 [Sphingobium yanoikuyae]